MALKTHPSPPWFPVWWRRCPKEILQVPYRRTLKCRTIYSILSAAGLEFVTFTAADASHLASTCSFHSSWHVTNVIRNRVVSSWLRPMLFSYQLSTDPFLAQESLSFWIVGIWVLHNAIVHTVDRLTYMHNECLMLQIRITGLTWSHLDIKKFPYT